jgi:hypothetical protein
VCCDLAWLFLVISDWETKHTWSHSMEDPSSADLIDYSCYLSAVLCKFKLSLPVKGFLTLSAAITISYYSLPFLLKSRWDFYVHMSDIWVSMASGTSGF